MTPPTTATAKPPRIVIAALAAQLMAWFVLLSTQAEQIQWISDDHALVYGEGSGRWPDSFVTAMAQGGHGRLSAHRLLCYPVIGYVGWMLGPDGAHRFQFYTHAAVALLAGLLLLRLRWGIIPSLTAAAAFAFAPWVGQPVFWWSSVCTALSTLFTLLAAHAYLNWARRGSVPWLAAAMLAMFTSLLLYEIWLTGYVLFFMLDLYLRRTERSNGPAPRNWIADALRAFARSSPMLVVFAVWAVWFVMTYQGDAHQPHPTSLSRKIIVLASIHGRVVNWFISTPWSAYWRQGLTLGDAKHAWMMWLWPASVAFLTFIVLMIRLKGQPQHRASEPATRPHDAWALPPLLPGLLLAWGVFLGSRLIFILQGGIALHTRHNYGAAIGAAIAAALLVGYLRKASHSVAYRRLLNGCVLVALIAMALAQLGAAKHFRKTSEAEAETVRLLPSLNFNGVDLLVVGGHATDTRGELSYFSEEHGLWLAFHARKLAPDIKVIVDPDAVSLPAHAPENSTLLLVWRDGQLTTAHKPHLREGQSSDDAVN